MAWWWWWWLIAVEDCDTEQVRYGLGPASRAMLGETTGDQEKA